MFGLGVGELLIILVIVLVVFGARKLPELGESLGKGIGGFQKALQHPPAEIETSSEAVRQQSPDN